MYEVQTEQSNRVGISKVSVRPQDPEPINGHIRYCTAACPQVLNVTRPEILYVHVFDRLHVFTRPTDFQGKQTDLQLWQQGQVAMGISQRLLIEMDFCIVDHIVWRVSFENFTFDVTLSLAISSALTLFVSFLLFFPRETREH